MCSGSKRFCGETARGQSEAVSWTQKSKPHHGDTEKNLQFVSGQLGNLKIRFKPETPSAAWDRFQIPNYKLLNYQFQCDFAQASAAATRFTIAGCE
jgi:hypothetical protein